MYKIHWFNGEPSSREFDTPEEAYEQVISALGQVWCSKGRNNRDFYTLAEFPIVNKAYLIGSNGSIVDGGEVYLVK